MQHGVFLAGILNDLGASLLAGLRIARISILILVHGVHLLDVELGELVAKIERLHWIGVSGIFLVSGF